MIHTDVTQGHLLFDYHDTVSPGTLTGAGEGMKEGHTFRKAIVGGGVLTLVGRHLLLLGPRTFVHLLHTAQGRGIARGASQALSIWEEEEAAAASVCIR